MRNKVTDMHQSGKGYKATSKAREPHWDYTQCTKKTQECRPQLRSVFMIQKGEFLGEFLMKAPAEQEELKDHILWTSD